MDDDIQFFHPVTGQPLILHSEQLLRRYQHDLHIVSNHKLPFTFYQEIATTLMQNVIGEFEMFTLLPSIDRRPRVADFISCFGPGTLLTEEAWNELTQAEEATALSTILLHQVDLFRFVLDNFSLLIEKEVLSCITATLKASVSLYITTVSLHEDREAFRRFLEEGADRLRSIGPARLWCRKCGSLGTDEEPINAVSLCFACSNPYADWKRRQNRKSDLATARP